MRVRGILGTVWALLAIPIILATFIGNQGLAGSLVAATGVSISPRITGAEIVRAVDHGAYRTFIHRPVFDGLIGEESSGFVQIDWKAIDGRLPGHIVESIDYDRDGADDFRIRIDTRTNRIQLVRVNQRVISVGQIYRFQNERVVRINLQNHQ
ncbi:MAG TPA: hypothetical protein VF531_16170 [Bacillota bacterium]